MVAVAVMVAAVAMAVAAVTLAAAEGISAADTWAACTWAGVGCTWGVACAWERQCTWVVARWGAPAWEAWLGRGWAVPARSAERGWGLARWGAPAWEECPAHRDCAAATLRAVRLWAGIAFPQWEALAAPAWAECRARDASDRPLLRPVTAVRSALVVSLAVPDWVARASAV